MSQSSLFSGPVKVLTSAAAAVGVIFGLFNSVLSSLVPPTDHANQTIGFSSILTIIPLLLITLIIKNKLNTTHRRTTLLIALLLFAGALAIYFPYRSFIMTHTYYYPPSAAANDTQTRHINGDLHKRGIQLKNGSTIAQAVFELGGPAVVDASELLWTADERDKAIMKMDAFYVSLTIILTTLIFLLCTALWRDQQAPPG